MQLEQFMYCTQIVILLYFHWQYSPQIAPNRGHYLRSYWIENEKFLFTATMHNLVVAPTLDRSSQSSPRYPQRLNVGFVVLPANTHLAIAQCLRTVGGQYFYAANVGALSVSNCSGVL
jgi:hypothetical protein